MIEHTPWSATRQTFVTPYVTRYATIRDADENIMVVLTIHDDADKLDKILQNIVRACNAHDDLVAALREMINWNMAEPDANPSAYCEAMERARAALAKAEAP
jgi:hypothetical protein